MISNVFLSQMFDILKELQKFIKQNVRSKIYSIYTYIKIDIVKQAV